MKIQPPKYDNETDIILCNIECLDKTNTIIAIIKERILFSEFRGLYSETNYTKHINKDVLNKTKIIKLVPIKIIGTANKN